MNHKFNAILLLTLSVALMAPLLVIGYGVVFGGYFKFEQTFAAFLLAAVGSLVGLAGIYELTEIRKD